MSLRRQDITLRMARSVFRSVIIRLWHAFLGQFLEDGCKANLLDRCHCPFLPESIILFWELSFQIVVGNNSFTFGWVQLMVLHIRLCRRANCILPLFLAVTVRVDHDSPFSSSGFSLCRLALHDPGSFSRASFSWKVVCLWSPSMYIWVLISGRLSSWLCSSIWERLSRFLVWLADCCPTNSELPMLFFLIALELTLPRLFVHRFTWQVQPNSGEISFLLWQVTSSRYLQLVSWAFSGCFWRAAI